MFVLKNICFNSEGLCIYEYQGRIQERALLDLDRMDVKTRKKRSWGGGGVTQLVYTVADAFTVIPDQKEDF